MLRITLRIISGLRSNRNRKSVTTWYSVLSRVRLRVNRHQGRSKASQNKASKKVMHIRKVIREQSKDFDGRFSDAKITKEYLPTVAREAYYKYKKMKMNNA